MAQDLAAAFSGAVGQFVGTMFTFPLDVVKTRMMAVTGKASQLEMMMTMFKEDGVLGVYSRFPSKGLQQGTTRFTYYYVSRVLVVARLPDLIDCIVSSIRSSAEASWRNPGRRGLGFGRIC
jgi:hypothetical protein